MRKKLTAATAIAGAIVMAAPTSAFAGQTRTLTGGNPEQSRSATDGTGDATARAHARFNGRLNIADFAQGGGAGTGLPGAPTGTASANSRAGVTRITGAGDGTYRIAFRFIGIVGNDRDSGETGDSDLSRRSAVQFISNDGTSSAPIVRTQSVRSTKGRQRTVVFISVPDGEAGRLKLSASLVGHAEATDNGDGARARAHTDTVRFNVNRLND